VSAARWKDRMDLAELGDWRDRPLAEKNRLAWLLDAEAACMSLAPRRVTPEQVLEFRIAERLEKREKNRLEEIAICEELERRKKRRSL
jgi:hypothetical protein